MTGPELLRLVRKAAPAIVAADRLEELTVEERATLVLVLEAELDRPVRPYRWRPSLAYLSRRRDRTTGRWISA